MPHTGLSFFHNGISFCYLIKNVNYFRTYLKRRFVNKTEDILLTSSKGDLIRTVSVRKKGSNAYNCYFKGLISEKSCWSTYYADHVEHCVA